MGSTFSLRDLKISNFCLLVPIWKTFFNNQISMCTYRYQTVLHGCQVGKSRGAAHDVDGVWGVAEEVEGGVEGVGEVTLGLTLTHNCHVVVGRHWGGECFVVIFKCISQFTMK